MRIDLKELIRNFPKRKQDSHKGTYGKVLNIAGSRFYTGAAILSSLSALKVGAGYLTLACPDNISNIIASYSPDITYLPLKSTNGVVSADNFNFVIEKYKEYNILSIGSGLSQNEEVQKFVLNVLSNINTNSVIDADALNIMAYAKFTKIPDNSVITPHPMELSRLLEVPVSEIQSSREKYAVSAAKKYNCVVVLKGHNTIVTDGERTYINSSGNSALAKAGTGDVLVGTIAGIAAQMNCSDMFMASSIGVYLHGLAADIAVLETTEYGLLASELINYLPKAIKKAFEI